MSKYLISELQPDFQRLHRKYGMSIHYVSACTSTHDIALELASTGWRGVVLTRHQHQGRGRLGRHWLSEPDVNLLISWVVDVRCPLSVLPTIPLKLAAEIASKFDCYVKWPNDLMSQDGCKLGGILSVVHEVGEGEHTLAIGIGLNVNQLQFPPAVHATSLALLAGTPQDMGSVLEQFVQVLSQFSPEGDFELWRERSLTLGRNVEVGEIRGVATGIREDGALIVNGIPITSGDVNLLEM